MPTISRFYGIVIRMYFSDHPPQHFHAVYAGEEAVVVIDSGEILRGEHRDELSANWDRLQEPAQPAPIDPLP